jgi:hypothetical protein
VPIAREPSLRWPANELNLSLIKRLENEGHAAHVKRQLFFLRPDRRGVTPFIRLDLHRVRCHAENRRQPSTCIATRPLQPEKATHRSDTTIGISSSRRHPSYSVFADAVAFPNLPFKLFAASSDLVEIGIRNMTFHLDLALRLPIPCSILSGNVLQSLGEHIATLNVDGRIVFQHGFANAPASAGTRAAA